jgi:hypothetical protein
LPLLWGRFAFVDSRLQLARPLLADTGVITDDDRTPRTAGPVRRPRPAEPVHDSSAWSDAPASMLTAIFGGYACRRGPTPLTSSRAVTRTSRRVDLNRVAKSWVSMRAGVQASAPGECACKSWVCVCACRRVRRGVHVRPPNRVVSRAGERSGSSTSTCTGRERRFRRTRGDRTATSRLAPPSRTPTSTTTCRPARLNGGLNPPAIKLDD